MLISVAACRQGEKLIVATVKTSNDTILHKMAVFGILPGAECRILQTRPAFVLQVGHTLLAVDRIIAGTIYGYK